MGKRSKLGSKPVKKAVEPPKEPALHPPTLHPPARRPLLLAVSIVLFGLWLAFLIVATLWN